MEALKLSTQRVRAAMKLASVLLLAAYASAPAAAHDTASVDKRSMAQAAADEQKRELEEMRLVNVDARRNAQHLQRQILGLQAEVIDRECTDFGGATVSDPVLPSPSLRRSPVRGINIGNLLAETRQRFWGPCSPNPWTNPLFVGPPKRRPIDGASHREQRRQQRAAIDAWEDEGGSIAASIGMPRP